jgi:hypothetical protein
VFVGPEIGQSIQDVKFKDQLSEAEKIAWKSLKNVTTNFLGNQKAENYFDIVADVIESYKTMGFNIFRGAFRRLSLRLRLQKSQGTV